jgi:metal-dependent amidase/aminoacylase/carboxypeptidase family protein
VAAGLATAEILRQRKLGGKVVLFGTPAEEGKLSILDSVTPKEHIC